jgi:dephospho-CoA kinase
MAQSGACDVCVVEVPLLDRMGSLVDLADEVVCVTCPFEVRRARARERGVEEADFDRRATNQPSDEYLRDHADTVIENGGDQEELEAAVRAWWDGHVASGWSRTRGSRR